MTTSQKIIKILKEKDLTPSQLSDNTGVSVRTIERYVSGESKKISLDPAMKINESYPEYSVDWLKNNDDNDNNENKIPPGSDIQKEITRCVEFLHNHKKEAEKNTAYNMMKENNGLDWALKNLSKNP